MATVNEQRLVLRDLHVLSVRDLVGLWREVDVLPSPDFRRVITAEAPKVVGRYAGAASELAAGWYDELAPELPYRAVLAAPPADAALVGSTEWALSAVGEAALGRLSGFAQRTIFNAARDTTLLNVESERGARWARHASANACAFCRMLATRGAVYSSSESAGSSGGYHDNCHCMAVAVRPGRSYQPPSYVERWEEEYQAAVTATGGGTSEVLAHMRSSE